MTQGLRLEPVAELDVAEAAHWYEQQRAGLGWEFLAELDRLLDRIRESPHQFPMATPDCRRALMRRFPYGVYFLQDHARTTILAVLHLHRHPDSWAARGRP